jgi:hypothetical protein
MVALHLYVEGGGESKALRTECREGFRKLLEKSGLTGAMPRITACGGRSDAFDAFKTAVSAADGSTPILLVDAEAPVTGKKPWSHVKKRQGDGWAKPKEARDEQLHLMVQSMEAWLVADRTALAEFYGQGFRTKALPAATVSIEELSKDALLGKLEAATRDAVSKGRYDKGGHSFKLLGMIGPAHVRAASAWAERFFSTLARLASIGGPVTKPRKRR